MTLKDFFKSFDLFADAPNAVQQMRKLILKLAFQGKLVPQNPSEESAETLVEKLKQTTRQNLPPATTDDHPFSLPPGWLWERLGNIGETNIGLTYSPQNISDTGVPVLRSNNIYRGKLNLSDIVRVNLQPKPSVMVHEGDLLICARNGSKALVGKTAIIGNLQEPMAWCIHGDLSLRTQ